MSGLVVGAPEVVWQGGRGSRGGKAEELLKVNDEHLARRIGAFISYTHITGDRRTPRQLRLARPNPSQLQPQPTSTSANFNPSQLQPQPTSTPANFNPSQLQSQPTSIPTRDTSLDLCTRGVHGLHGVLPVEQRAAQTTLGTGVVAPARMGRARARVCVWIAVPCHKCAGKCGGSAGQGVGKDQHAGSKQKALG